MNLMKIGKDGKTTESKDSPSLNQEWTIEKIEAKINPQDLLDPNHPDEIGDCQSSDKVYFDDYISMSPSFKLVIKLGK